MPGVVGGELLERTSVDVADGIDGDAQVAEAARLVLRAQAGDEDAFAELVSSHDVALRRATSRMLDGSDADDVAQDVWLRVRDRLLQLNDPYRFRSWLYRIARNACLNVVRATRSTRKQEDRSATRWHDVHARPSTQPESALLFEDEQRRVWEALGRLSDNDRLVLRLRGVDKLGYAEIARLLSTSAHAAEVRSARARDRFRMHYERVDLEASSGHTSGLQLRALIISDGRPSPAVSRHVAECARCRARVAAMRLGNGVFAAIAPLVLAPLALWRLANEERRTAFLQRMNDFGSPGFARVSALTSTPVLQDAGTALGGAAGVVAAVTLSVTIALGTTGDMAEAAATAIDGATANNVATVENLPPSKFALDLATAPLPPGGPSASNDADATTGPAQPASSAAVAPRVTANPATAPRAPESSPTAAPRATAAPVSAAPTPASAPATSSAMRSNGASIAAEAASPAPKSRRGNSPPNPQQPDPKANSGAPAAPRPSPPDRNAFVTSIEDDTSRGGPKDTVRPNDTKDTTVTPSRREAPAPEKSAARPAAPPDRAAGRGNGSAGRP